VIAFVHESNHGVRGHLLVLAELAFARGAFVDVVLAVGCHRDHTRHAVLALGNIVKHAIRYFLDCFLHSLLFPQIPLYASTGCFMVEM
jgi:hypothetical protein